MRLVLVQIVHPAEDHDEDDAQEADAGRDPDRDGHAGGGDDERRDEEVQDAAEPRNAQGCAERKRELLALEVVSADAFLAHSDAAAAEAVHAAANYHQPVQFQRTAKRPQQLTATDEGGEDHGTDPHSGQIEEHSAENHREEVANGVGRVEERVLGCLNIQVVAQVLLYRRRQIEHKITPEGQHAVEEQDRVAEVGFRYIDHNNLRFDKN